MTCVLPLRVGILSRFGIDYMHTFLSFGNRKCQEKMPRENEVPSVADIECCCLGLKRSDSKMNA